MIVFLPNGTENARLHPSGSIYIIALLVLLVYCGIQNFFSKKNRPCSVLYGTKTRAIFDFQAEYFQFTWKKPYGKFCLAKPEIKKYILFILR